MKLIAFIIITWSLSAFAAEKEILKEYPKIFQRQKDTLTIHLENGKALTFKDINADDGTHLSTEVTDYFKKRKLALIHQKYYEGGDYKLISLTSGKELVIPGTPIWNSDHKYFAVANDDESTYTQSTFIIGRCDDKDCTKLFEREERSGDVKWKNPTTVTVQIRKYDENGEKVVKATTLTCELVKDKASCKE